MKNLIKWLLKKLGIDGINEILKWGYALIPMEDWINGVCDYLAVLANKTETQIDDEFVENLRETLKQLLLTSK